MHIVADVSLFFNNGHVELEDDDHDVVEVRMLMHIVADVSLFFNNGHVELEDDDHDVVDVISPLSFKVEMNNLMVSSIMLKDILMVMMMTKMT